MSGSAEITNSIEIYDLTGIDSAPVTQTAHARKRWVGYATYLIDEPTASSLGMQKLNLQPLWQGGDDILVACLTDVVGAPSLERPGLAQLMTMVRGHECDAVAIDGVYRLSLSVGELLEMFDEMQEHGVDLHDAQCGKLDWMRAYILALSAHLARDFSTDDDRCQAPLDRQP